MSTSKIAIILPKQAADALQTIVQDYYDYLKVAEQEETKRQDIFRRTEVELARISAMRDSLLHYLDRSFDERRENFAAFFRTVDKAVDEGDVKVVQSTLSSIVELAKSSPFKMLTIEEAEQILNDPNAEIEFDG